ncbi:hypothetical protein MPSEU_000982500 [Mayamaea pseudoterrestris]|nr:hypothetical protein MPSEU_000982500 [Mayamaea pseudoterrestris]
MPFSSHHNMGVSSSKGRRASTPYSAKDYEHNRERFKTFPGSAFLEKTFCGSIDTTDPAEYEGTNLATRMLHKADVMCISSPTRSHFEGFLDDDDDEEDEEEDDDYYDFDEKDDASIAANDAADWDEDCHAKKQQHRQKTKKQPPVSALFARALVSEVTDNPKTMRPAQMADREYRLLKAQKAARLASESTQHVHRAVGAPGGVGPPSVLRSMAYACTGDEAIANGGNGVSGAGPLLMQCAATPGRSSASNAGGSGSVNGGYKSSGTTLQTSSPRSHVRSLRDGASSHMMMSAQHQGRDGMEQSVPRGPHSVTIGLCLSRQSAVGHSETVTRQTAFDFNELQDRSYKYVSSTDKHGWRAGGGEQGGSSTALSDENKDLNASPPNKPASPTTPSAAKVPTIDQVHIPIIHIDCPNEAAVSKVIQALASGDIFIPHMAVLPEALSVQGASPPSLVVRFDCDRTEDDSVPDDWPNWSLEFMHNQLYEYFINLGAQWMERPFSITLAQQVRWKTVKHMNRYFSKAEKILEEWKQRGPKYLDPELSFLQGGATADEVAYPHGLYLFRNGTPTNYFAPNFDPPYTTRMTRSLLLNVLNKSWDKKARDWTSVPIPKLVTPTMLLAVACGCSDPSSSGFMAREVTNNVSYKTNTSTSTPIKPDTPHEQQRVPAFQKSQAQSLSVSVAPAAPVKISASDYQQAAVAAMKSIREETEDELFEGLEEDEDGDGDGDDVNDERFLMDSRHDRSNAGVVGLSPSKTASSFGSSVKNATRFSVDSAVESGMTTVNTATVPRLSSDLVVMSRPRGSPSSGSDPPGESLQSKTPRHFSESVFLEHGRSQRSDSQERSFAQNATPKNHGVSSSPNASSTFTTRSSRYAMDPVTSPLVRRHTPQMGNNLSNPLSLDYSTDGSSAFLTTTMDESSMLFGQNLATVESGSVFSSVSSLRQPFQHPAQQQLRGPPDTPVSRRPDAEASLESDLSLSQSDSCSSYESVVPSDEDLFEIGWAKALDPKSGAYYYFTLDRTHTVWENPLDPMSTLGDSQAY